MTEFLTQATAPPSVATFAGNTSVSNTKDRVLTLDDVSNTVLAWNPEFCDMSLANGKKCTFRGIVRSDTGAQLGAVAAADEKRSKYHILNNDQLIDTLRPVIDSGIASVNTAMEYKGGKVVAIQLKVDGLSKEIVKGEGNTDFFINIFNNVAGKGALHVVGSTNRLICCNQMNAILKGQEMKFNLTHCKSIESRYAGIMKFIEECASSADQLWNDLRSLKDTRTSKEMLDKVLDLVAARKFDAATGEETTTTRTQNIRDAVKWHMDCAVGNAGSQDLYGVLQGVTAYYSHGKQTDAYITPELAKIRNRSYSYALGADVQKAANVYNYVLAQAA